MIEKPLISVIIVSYKNYKYIYQAIDSVLLQDYKNIELIISNDGSDDFNKKAVEIYFKKHSNKNIKRIVVNNNKKNIGTVKNLNKAISLSKGKYILSFAADDVIYNKGVISKFISAFNKLPKEELIVTSQVGMYDLKLKFFFEYFITKENKEKIKTLTPKELFGELSLGCIISGVGTCYKRSIFDLYGFFDERYLLVEDYSSSLKYSRLGIKYNYFDFVSFKHRDGGVSHGDLINCGSSSKKYQLDMINIIKNEILPNMKLLNNKQKVFFIKGLAKKVLDKISFK